MSYMFSLSEHISGVDMQILLLVDCYHLWQAERAGALSLFELRARLVDYLFPMSKVLKIRVGRSGKKKKEKKGRSTYNRYQISLFVTEILPMPRQEVQICVHDVHETHFPLYYSSACSYRKLCRFEKC